MGSDRTRESDASVDSDVQYVELALFREAQCPRRVAVIEMKAELSFSNNTRLIERIRALLDGGHKLIVVSLNLTAFVDTTAIRQIVGLFEDARDAFICLSQCRPKVMELIHRYENSVDVFPQNVRSFVSTHDAVRFLQRMCDDEEHSMESDGAVDVERSLSPLSAKGLQIIVTPNDGDDGDDASLMRAAKEKLRDFRSTPRSTTREPIQIDSDSEREELVLDGADGDGEKVTAVKWSEVESVVLKEMAMEKERDSESEPGDN